MIFQISCKKYQIKYENQMWKSLNKWKALKRLHQIWNSLNQIWECLNQIQKCLNQIWKCLKWENL